MPRPRLQNLGGAPASDEAPIDHPKPCPTGYPLGGNDRPARFDKARNCVSKKGSRLDPPLDSSQVQVFGDIHAFSPRFAGSLALYRA
jgi:hypothetical protein